ncbi:hypothetical protein LCGC14_2002140 [marine sediment metagenome]|uniref:LexA repressor DNA-binding domain-containing protein n=1 Tax=marine sediment metagenome TaxID=412755 RepID=A0A0F9HZZ0_9ZZZZ
MSAQPGQQTASINDAYTELSKAAFAIWIRLMTETNPAHLQTKKRVAKVLGYSSDQACKRVLEELVEKGYIEFRNDSKGPGCRLVLVKRALLVGRDHFVRLSG